MGSRSRPPIPPSDLGVDIAARLSGIPEATLRLHVDQGRVLGVRRLPSGRRLISREGLLAYLQARGIPPRGLDGIDRRESGRVGTRPPGVRVRILSSREAPAGEGEGLLADLSAAGLRIEGLSWRGWLPGPDTPVAFRVQGGRLKGAGGRARLAWLVYRHRALGMGLRVLRMDDAAARVRWDRSVAAGLVAKRRLAERLASGA